MTIVNKRRILLFIFITSRLKFDGEFIIYWLLTHNFNHVEDKEEIENNTFTTLISDMGLFYQITIYFKKQGKHTHKVTFIDSLKIIPFAVKDVAKSFNLPINKLSIDYGKHREKGHILTDEEKNYIKNDVLIMAKSLNVLFNQNLTKMTQGSNALSDFKEITGLNRFNHYFPNVDDIYENLKKAYKGGFTYLNPIYKEKEVSGITILDVNSLYPFCMHDKLLPYGEPIYFKGKYEDDKVYPLYIQMITCRFRLKKNKIPTIQIKNNSYYKENEYLTTSQTIDGDEPVTLTLTNIDLKLFLENYDIVDNDIKYFGGWKFRGLQGIFNEYIDKWIKIKNESTLNGNIGMRTLAKLMLNALYGKFATSLDAQGKVPYLGDDGCVHYKLGKEQNKKGLYIPMGCFITAYAREKTIRTSQSIKDYSLKKYGKDMYIYSDTDSVHTTLSIEELKQFCEIDNIKLGAWKNEGYAEKGKFIKQKCYIEKFYKKLKYTGKINKIKNNKKYIIKGLNNYHKVEITCAGMPESCYKYVNWNSFKSGFSCKGKLQPIHIKGGVKLIETEFTIKEEKVKKAFAEFDKK